MNTEEQQKIQSETPTKNTAKTGWKGKSIAARSGKECAYLAVFVAMVIAAQLALSLVPGVEVVTLLFVSYAFVFGVRRGLIAATAFALLRQIVFGVYPTVLVLYLVYFNGLAVLFGLLGKTVKNTLRSLWWLVLVACLCTVCFTMLDNLITPLWLRYTERAWKAYFMASLPFMVPQLLCTGVSVGVLFLPLQRVFRLVKKSLN